MWPRRNVVVVVKRLRREAVAFRVYAGVYAVLSLIGSALVAQDASQVRKCTQFAGCYTDYDTPRALGVTLGLFLASLLLVLPLLGIARLLDGMAKLVKD